MLEPQIKNEIKEEADDLIRLGNLLRVNRDTAAQQAVEKVIRGDWTIQQKIDKIEALDRAAAEEPQERPGAGASGSQVRPEIRRQGPLKTISRGGNDLSILEAKDLLPTIIHNIKANHVPLPYISFLFREYKKMKEFGKRTHILVPVLFPPSIRINEDLGKGFVKYLAPLSAQLLEVLNPILSIGWLYLTKSDYNLLVILKKLCLEISTTNFHLLNYKDKKLLLKLRTLENLFLHLHYHTEYQSRMFSAVETVLNRNKEIKADSLIVSKAIKKLLSENIMLPSLYNFLLGLNMIQCRRSLHLNELIHRVGSDIVASENFDCHEAVYEKIKSFIERSIKSLAELHKKKMEIQKQRIFLPINDKGEADFTQLQLFYDARKTEAQYNYSKDKENIVQFIPQFLRLYLKTFEKLLNGKIDVGDSGHVEIFSPNFFQIEFTKLSYLNTKMEKIAFDFPHFPRNRYLGIKTANTGAITIESEMMHLIEESLVHLLGIARKLTKVLGQRQKKGKEEEEAEILDLNVLRGKAFVLPYENEYIKSSSLLCGKTVQEALSMAVSINFLFGIYLNDQDSLSLLNMEKSIDFKIKGILEKMERIADRESYAGMVEKYGSGQS